MTDRRVRVAHVLCGAYLLLLSSAAVGASTLDDETAAPKAGEYQTPIQKPQTLIDEGRAAYEAGAYQTAIEKWQALIRQGNPDGLYFLGIMYDLGKGLAQDKAKAFQLYSEAAEKDHVPAQYNLGMQYATGEGVAQDFKKTEYWWTKAAQSGLMQAQFNLGNLYYYGVIGEKNLALARKWMTLAADQGSPLAKDILTKLDSEVAQTTVKPVPTARPKTAPRATAETATPTKTETVAENKTTPEPATFKREAWILAQPPGHYTIQIMAIDSESSVQAFIRKQNLSDTAAYFETPAKGGSLFRVVYGSYASRALATKALAALPRSGESALPWIRTFAELHKLVDRRNAQRGAP